MCVVFQINTHNFVIRHYLKKKKKRKEKEVRAEGEGYQDNQRCKAGGCFVWLDFCQDIGLA